MSQTTETGFASSRIEVMFKFGRVAMAMCWGIADSAHVTTTANHPGRISV
jgi:hypothetical protein